MYNNAISIGSTTRKRDEKDVQNRENKIKCVCKCQIFHTWSTILTTRPESSIKTCVHYVYIVVHRFW